MALAHLALLMALQAPKAPPPKAPPDLHNPLIIPRPNTNLSAFRLDTEVFGWNKAFTEVGTVAMEMARNEDGAHRGETFLLVYPTRSTKPKHNVICHFITHVALPDNPIPLENAHDYLWTIEWSYQNMWPRRPKHTRPKDGMRVTPLWAPMPPAASAAAQEPPPTAAGGASAVRHASGADSCVPWVGFRLQLGSEVRLHPYRPLDLSARCSLLQLTDSRTYWGTPTIAASMVRFDFNASPVNEESARFVVSALWSEARHVRFEVQAAAPLAAKQLRAWRRVLRPWGSLMVRVPKTPAPKAAPAQTLTIRAAPGWLPMAHALARDLGYADAATVAQQSMGDTIVLALAAPKTGEALDTAGAEAPKSALDEAPMRPADAPSAQRRDLQAPNVAPPPPAAPSRYLHDFKVP